MNLKPIINEMRAYWLEGQTGGQLLIGGHEAHYDADKTPPCIIEAVTEVAKRKQPATLLLWEIEAEERLNLFIEEKLV